MQEPVLFKNLVFRSSYNTCLFNFIDKLSRWSPFTSPEMHQHWKENFGFNKEDDLKIKGYKKARAKLGWDKAADLLDWAYTGFPPSKEYLDILECVRYFESRVNKQGQQLKDEVKESLLKVKNEEQNIRTEIF